MRRLITASSCAILLLQALATVTVAAEASAEDRLTDITTNVRDSWKALAGGFRYRASGRYAIFITAKAERDATGRMKTKSIVELKEPIVTTCKLECTFLGDLHRVY